MPEPTPPLDLDAVEARYQDWRHDQDGPSALHWDELVATEELCNAVPALLARVRALEAEVARLQPSPPRGQACYICGQCPVVARDAENFWFCAQHAGSDCTPL